MRRLAVAVFALVLLVLAALGGGLGFFLWQPDRLIQPLTAWLARQHVTARFEGPLTLTFAPRPKLRARDVTLERSGVRLHAQSLTAQIALRPLLRGRVVVVRLDLDGVDLSRTDLPAALSSLGGGAPGEVKATPPAPSSSPPASPAPARPHPLRLVLRDVSLHEGTLRLGGAPLEIERLDIGPPRFRDRSAPRQIELDARYQNVAFSLSVIAATKAGQILLESGRLSAPQGNAAFDLTLSREGLPRLTGTIALHRLDLDALRHALPRRPRPAPAAAPPSSSAPPPAAPSAPPPSPFPFAALTKAEADLTLSADDVIESEAHYRNFSTHLRLAGGILTLDPLRGSVPGGEVEGRFEAHAAPPALSLTLSAPNLALGPVIAAFHWPEEGSRGSVAVKLALTAQGDTPEAWRESLAGAAGLAAVDAAVSNAVLLRGLAALLPSGSLPLFALKAEGASAVRCLALRTDATAGLLRLTAARLETSRLLAAAAGTVALGPRQLDLTLVPALSVAHDWVIVPFRLEGPFDKPHWQPDPDMADADLLRKGDCAAALAAARFGASGPLPAAPPPEAGRHKANLRDLLDSLIK